MSWDRVHESWKKVSGTTRGALGSLARRSYGVLRRDRHPDERKKTNDSLRGEREKADQALSAKQEKISDAADAIVDRARDDADAVLDAAREKADGLLSGVPGANPEAAVVRERKLADEALRKERDSADEALRREREENIRILMRLVPLERESTDRYLKSERVRSDDALSNRDDFLAIVAHDLRDLIGGIVMSATEISHGIPDGEPGRKTREHTRRIERYAARMNRLIGDLVDVASIDAGKLAVAPASNDLATLIIEAKEMFRETASAKGITLEGRATPASLPATFDHDRILQVLANLISNSLKFTPKGGKITIVGDHDAGNLRLSVADTGTGIPEGALELIFERFSQAVENVHGGLGLGLYISRCIVEAHGGQIWAVSKPAIGSRICFTLPLRAETEAPTQG